jgi:hypothetical protein
MKPDYRAGFIEETNRLSGKRDEILQRLLSETDSRERNAMILILRMVNAKILQYRKAVQVIDGELSEADFLRWHVAETNTRRRRLLFLRELAADYEGNAMTPDARREFDSIRNRIQEESIEETHYFDQLSTAWEEVEATL